MPEKQTGIELRRDDGRAKAAAVEDVESFGSLIGMPFQEREPLHVVVEGQRQQDHPVTEHRVRLRDRPGAGPCEHAPAILRPSQDFAPDRIVFCQSRQDVDPDTMRGLEPSVGDKVGAVEPQLDVDVRIQARRAPNYVAGLLVSGLRPVSPRGLLREID